MKAKKSNAMWGVGLFLILGVLYFLNATDFLSKPLFPEAPKQDTAQAGPTKEQTNSMLTERVKKNRIQVVEPGQEGRAPAQTGIPSTAAIFKPKEQKYKPVPNETATSAQWYKKDNYVDKQSENVKKKRGY